LDDQVNAALNLEDVETKHRKWEIKKLLIDNFLCYGDDNNVDFSKLMGFNVVTSEPKNQGGKCLRSDTQIVTRLDPNKIREMLGYIPEELKKFL
jgi:hypothetical protein